MFKWWNNLATSVALGTRLFVFYFQFSCLRRTFSPRSPTVLSIPYGHTASCRSVPSSEFPTVILFGCVNALFFFFSGSYKNNGTSVSCTCPEVWLPWSNRIAIAFTPSPSPPQLPRLILISCGGNKHHAAVPSSSPTPPLSFLYGGALKAPLAALVAAPAAALAAAWRTA